MTLIKSISGFRGTIGGCPGENLTPIDIVAFASAYGKWILSTQTNVQKKIVIGRDARISGTMVSALVSHTLTAMGFNVVDLGFASTPTVEIAVPLEQADGGIILTASHNPKQWNALKLLNHKGEFISSADGLQLLAFVEDQNYTFADVDSLGSITHNDNYDEIHIQHILQLPLVNTQAIAQANFTVAIDSVNSVGGIILPKLLRALRVQTILELYSEPTGIFPHNPEPLPEHLTEIAELIQTKKADVGFVVDPDVDRLAIVCEDGSMFGEEYTLVAIADYVLQHTPGNTVSNLSSTRALADVTQKYGMQYTAAMVGEVNVVETMKQTNAVIGGEGNGGVIYPEFHYGRDALVGIALFLSHLATSNTSCKTLRSGYPQYVISKNKIELTPNINVDAILVDIANKYATERITTSDGVKIDFAQGWVHLRKSNTEPIIRIYAEHTSEKNAHELAQKIMQDIQEIINT